MDKKNVKSDSSEIEEFRFHQHKSLISVNEIGIIKRVVSNKFPFGKQDFKYFIGYKNSLKNGPFCIFFRQMIIYKTNFDENGVFIF